MKKTFINIATAIALVIGLSSCNLDAVVYSTMTSANYPQTEADAQALLDGMYGYLKTNSGSVNMNSTANTGWGWPVWSIGAIGWYGWQMCTSDEGRTGGFNSNVTDFLWDTSSQSWIQTFQIVKNVSRMTYIIDVIEKCEGIPAAKKVGLIAEAKALRGMFMYVIYDLFGPFHVTLKAEELDNIEYVARPSDDEYRNAMIQDFVDAEKDLVYDKTNNTPNWARINKGFVRCMLAKIYMRKHQYAQALPYLEAIVNSGNYKLDDDYFAPFAEEQNEENIYCIPSGPKADNEFFFYTTAGHYKGMLDVNRKHAHQIGVTFDGQPIAGEEDTPVFNCTPYWGGFKVQWDFFDTFSPYDVRRQGMTERILHTDGKIYTRQNPGSTNLQYGAPCCKYFYSQDRAYAGNIHSVCFRYADVLLMIAECDAMIQGKATQRSLDYIKQITDRANTTQDTPANIATDIEAFKEFILAERGRELYVEGWRRDDLLRFDKFISSAQARGCTKAAEKHKLMPIPIEVINESGGIITQNPGY